MIYPNSMSYLQICGTVRVHPAGTPDGFHTFDAESKEDYVHGVSITYGDSSNRKHICLLELTSLALLHIVLMEVIVILTGEMLSGAMKSSTVLVMTHSTDN